jgi:hypothetical protein
MTATSERLSWTAPRFPGSIGEFTVLLLLARSKSLLPKPIRTILNLRLVGLWLAMLILGTMLRRFISRGGEAGIPGGSHAEASRIRTAEAEKASAIRKARALVRRAD